MRRRRYARVVVRLRWWIIAAWLIGTAAATMWLPSVEEAQSGALGNLVPADSRAVEAERRAADLFLFPVLSRVVIVQRDPQGLSEQARRRVVTRAAALSARRIPRFSRSVLGAIPLVNVGPIGRSAREQGTTALTYLFFDPDIGSQGQRGLAALLIEREISAPGDAAVGVTGAVPAQAEQIEQITTWLPLVELGTVLLVAFAVGLHFRAILAPLVTLVCVAVSYLAGAHGAAGLGQSVGLTVPQEVEPVVVVLVFGVVTDYAVFFLSRFRRRLAEGDDRFTAAETTIADLLTIILTAGLAVIAGAASLLVADLFFFRVFGPGLAIAVAVALAASVTLLPAALAAFGGAIFWPSRPGRDVQPERAREEPETSERPVRSRLLAAVARHPVIAAAVCLLLLVPAAAKAADLRVGQTLIRGLPEDAKARVAYEAARRGFAPGVMSPTVVLIEGDGIAARRRALARVQRRVERLPGVALVAGPRQQPSRETLGVVYAPAGDAARMVVIFDSDPLGAAAINRARRLDERVERALERAGVTGARVSLIGDTALAAEIVDAAGEDLARVAPATLIAVTFVLVVFLRALVAPLYLVAASVLALAAALGLTVLVFQELLGHAELTYYVPFVASVLLVSLGSDYNVFLAGRVWQEARLRRSIREAVAVGGTRAARAITVAGLVLALSFALLAVVPLQPFRELAFMMFAGLLLDAFIVRTVLVPALLAMFGRGSGWPGRSLLVRPRARKA